MDVGLIMCAVIRMMSCYLLRGLLWVGFLVCWLCRSESLVWVGKRMDVWWRMSLGGDWLSDTSQCVNDYSTATSKNRDVC